MTNLIRDKISNGKLENGIKLLKELINSDFIHFRDEVELISYRINSIEETHRKGILDSGYVFRVRNKLVNDLLKLVTKIEAQISSNSGFAKIRKLNFFIYISQTKIDMLFQQLVNEKNVDLTLYQKVYLIDEYLAKTDQIGDTENVKDFIKGNLVMNWGCNNDHAPEIVFFGFRDKCQKIAFIGSRGSMIGEKKTNSTHNFHFYEHEFLRADPNRNKVSNAFNEKGVYCDLENAFDLLFDSVNNKKQEIEFLAKITRSVKRGNEKIIVGSPLYMVLAN